MRALVSAGMICVGVVCTGVALAAPQVSARAKYQIAVRLDDSGEYEKALVSIEEGLAVAPKDLPLLGLKGAVLLKLHKYVHSLAAYQAYLDAGAAGADRREAQKIVDSLRPVQSTFLDISLANGPAEIYLDSRTQGVFCTAAPACHDGILPGVYKVIAERPGFERWTGSVTIQDGRTATLAITLVEKPSLLTVRVAQAGARIVVDDAPGAASSTVSAGTHRIVVSLAGYAATRLEATAHEGKPVEIDAPLVPLVPIRIDPPIATLLLDDKPAAVEDGGIAIPPGRHVLVARAPGFRDQRIEIPAERTPDYQLSVALASGAVPPEVAEQQGARTRRLVGLGLGAAGVAALGAGVVFAAKARSSHDEAIRLCGDDLLCDSSSTYDDAHGAVVRAKSQATTATVLIAVGGAAVAAGVIVWLTAPRERHGPVARIVPAVDDHHVGLSVLGRF